jgi:hypothetical protein
VASKMPICVLGIGRPIGAIAFSVFGRQAQYDCRFRWTIQVV